jgi:hypothetical protein
MRIEKPNPLILKVGNVAGFGMGGKMVNLEAERPVSQACGQGEGMKEQLSELFNRFMEETDTEEGEEKS